MGKCKICQKKEEIPGTGYCSDCKPKSFNQVSTVDNVNYYFDSLYTDKEKEVFRPEIFTSAAQDFAKLLFKAKMARGQIRNLLRYLRGIEIPLRLPSKPNFNSISWQLDELYSYIIYQSNRDKQPIPPVFRHFFEYYHQTLKKDQREFVAFVKFVAGIYAYFTKEEADSKLKKYLEYKQKTNEQKKYKRY